MSDHALRLPETLRHYRILEKIGAGGMGEVYRSWDEHLDRQVAIKILPPGTLTNVTARKRFRKEALSLSRLNHPNVATVHDFDTQDGVDFLVMEYVGGKPLNDTLASGPLKESDVLHLGLQLADGLAAAHDQGVIHLDLKPANLRTTSDHRLKILDFGLARLAQPVSLGGTTTSFAEQPGGGTLPYMAPEQLRGEKVDARTDIYAAGAVLYEMTTGRWPFPETLPARLTDAILHDIPAPPSKLRHSISPGLDSIVLKCLEKDPDNRYQSAKELGVDLRRLAQPTGERISRPAKTRSHKGLLSTAAILVLAVFAGLMVYNRLHRPALPERVSILMADFDNTGTDGAPDKGLREGLTIALQQSRYVNVFPRAQAYEALRRMRRPQIERIDEQLGREICRRENVRVLLAGSINRIGDAFQITVRGIDAAQGDLLFAEKTQFRNKDAFFDQVDRIAGKVRRELGESLSGINNNSKPLAKVTTTSLEALQLYSRAADAVAMGKRDDVPGLLEAALTQDPDFAMAHELLGEQLAWMVGKNERSTAELQRAYELRNSVTDRERLRIEANYYDAREQYEKSAQSLQALMSLYPDDADVHEQLAMAYYNLANLSGAIREMREAVRRNPYSAPAYGRLVLTLARDNQNDEAIRTYNEAHRYGLTSSYLDWAVGLGYLGEGKLAEAREQFTSLQQQSDADHELGQVYLAVVDLYEGKFDAAREKLASELPAHSSAALIKIRRYLLGRECLLRRDINCALREANRIMAFPPADLQTVDISSAGLLYAYAGNTNMARQVLRRLDAIRKNTSSVWNNACFHNLEGEIALAEKNPDRALLSFQAATAEWPERWLHRSLARAYMAKRDWHQAAREWEQYQSARGEELQNGFPPDLIIAQLEIARAYRKLNEFDQAHTHYQQFLNAWPESRNLPLRQEAVRELDALEHANAAMRSTP